MTLENPFVMRGHTDVTEGNLANVASSWTFRRGAGILQNVAITKISNPLAQVKSASSDVPCVNGTVDLTERYGQVFYKNKTVEVEIQKTAAGRDEWEEMRDGFAALHGMVVDFAFAEADAVEWYYTGRLSVEGENEPSAKLTLKLDTYPFKQSAAMKIIRLPAATLIDRSANGWSVYENTGGATVTFNAGVVEIFGKAGDRVVLRRSAANANRYTIAPSTLLGGDYYFDNAILDSRTIGTPNGGYLYLVLELDGSYYAWDYHQGASVYRPCLHFDFAMTQLVVSDGNIDAANAVELPSNVRIRPLITNTGDDAVVLLDGEYVSVPAGSQKEAFPEAVLPGIRADRRFRMTTCYLSAFPVSLNDSPNVEIRFREEVLG